jgi:hypothetical protein
MKYNHTPANWAMVSPDAVASGSWAQARNVLEMALQDIARMARENERIRIALQEAIDVFAGMNDDEIDVELLPRLRRALSVSSHQENTP